MSGATIPYHLRQNKAVDRYAFIELLSKIDKVRDISQYQYIGFGGHSLEDFKYIHTRFGIQSMTSLEMDVNVWGRQKFNKPHNCITCLNEPSNVFFESFETDSETIIWLDYTAPSQIRDQIEEFQALLDGLAPYDIIKLTLNAHASAYKAAPKGATSSEIAKGRIELLRGRLGDLFPENDVDESLMSEKRFSEAIHQIVKFAANLAMRGNFGVYFQPLTSFSYADGQGMLTITGILLEHEQREVFFRDTGIDKWELANLDWSKPKRINVPDFTLRERLFIDSELPKSGAEEIQRKLGFLFDDSDTASLEMLKTYVLFYRQSPYFSRIFV